MKKRNGELDFWKFLFSIEIVIFHGKNLTTQGDNYFQNGALAVEFFFLVSGVLLAASADRNAIKAKQNPTDIGIETFQFMKHKISGLMPNYYVAWVIAFAVEHLGNRKPILLVKDLKNSVWELLLITETGLRGYYSNNVVWYISIMLILMLVLYPLIRTLGNKYYYSVAPFVFLLVMGITYHNFKSLGGPHIWRGFYYKCMARALMELILGTMCYRIAKEIGQKNYTRFGKLCWSLAEWAGFIWAILFMYCGKDGKTSWFLIMVLAMSVTICFARVGVDMKIFHSPIFNFLGVYSYSLYLGHGYWSHKMNLIFPNWTYTRKLPIYVLIAVVTGCFIMGISNLLKIFWKKKGKQIKGIFIVEDSVKEA